jgi:predicted unusual protein kinase regulating ubiquinone biosynthesis (AarF/ABC1/UbiB family)
VIQRSRKTFPIVGTVVTTVAAGAALGSVVRDPVRRIRVERTARVWRLTARRAAHLIRVRVLGTGASEVKRAQLEEQFVIRSAEDVAEVLGNMKGAIMKAGQMFSFIADGLPPDAAKALSTLQADVAPMAPSLAEDVIRRELGAGPEELFLDWDPVPVAAASIGQVHRAVLRDGRKVAVKVQYPGVDSAISSDLENAQLLYGMFSQFALPSLDVKAMIDEVRQRMLEELDYRIEATSQREFADYYVGHPFIRIPDVVPEFSGRRVLTSEWVDGLRWSEFLEQASEPAKQAAGEVLMRFAQGSVYFHRMFNGDPHPGNYKFHLDGTITFLDFGLVKRWSQEEINELTPVLDALLAQDAQQVAKQVEALDALPPGHGVDPNMILEYASTPYWPFIAGEYTFTREKNAAALEKVLDFEGRYRELLDKIDLPTSYIILDRLVWGVGALLGHLEAHNRWGALLDEYRHGAEPSTPMGEAEAQWRSEYHD